MPHTKIICTIGPSVQTTDKMVELIRAGMDVARLNFSHGTHEEHLLSINNLKEARSIVKQPLAIMLDTKGPEIRLGLIEGNYAELRAGQRWFLSKSTLVGNSEVVSLTPPEVLNYLSIGTVILFDNGYISSHVVECTPEGVWVQIENDGPIRSRKGVNIPNANVPLPAFTEKDAEDIRFGCKQGINMIAASFVRSADHVLAIKRLLVHEGHADISVMAKVENREGVENFDSIIQVADGIMIARGDLGVEVPIYEVPRLQKMMIRKAYLAGKPSVTATQMLESMISNPRPTRAEVSDVANAIYDSTSAVMLSGETAVGAYPLKVVDVMHNIVKETESDFDYRAFFENHSRFVYHDVPSAVTLATVKTAYSSGAKAIFCFTTTGATPRLLSRLRPSMPIVALTTNELCYHQLALHWGVVPFLSGPCSTIDDAKKMVTKFALEQKIVSYGDLVVITAGTPFGITGTTNTMMVESIGEVLVRGEHGMGASIHSTIAVVLAPESRKPYSVSGQILVITRCDESYEELIHESAGIILQNHIDDASSEKSLIDIATKFKKPMITRADGAIQTLKEGLLVTLDPEKALVYKGVVI